jgi:hypothetical protein
MRNVNVELNPGLSLQKKTFNKKKTFFTNKLELNFRKELVKCYIWSLAMYGAETWTLRKVDQKCIKNFERRRRIEKLVDPIV